ncbi:hypothetical protein J0H58_14760 [bacterium]|nr:hypothetical protein [bacterium]
MGDPDSVLAEIIDAVKPLLGQDRRRGLLLAAFAGEGGKAVLDRIDFTGANDTFAPALVHELLRFGEVEPGRPALVALLQSLAAGLGVDQRDRFDKLVAQLSQFPRQSSVPLPPALVAYHARVEDAVNRQDSPCPVPSARFGLKISCEDGVTIEIGQIWDRVRAEGERRTVLWGGAGAGKSTVVGAVVRQCLRQDSSHAPVLIDFKRWKRESSDQLIKFESELDPIKRLRWQVDLILRAGVPSLTVDQVEDLEKVRGVLIVADALNEVDRQETRTRILDILDEFRRRAPSRYLIVTDRTEHKELADGWGRLQILPLDEGERRQQLDAKFRERHPDGVYDTLTDGDKELLASPFFLQLAIRSEHPQLGSRAAALNDYFTRPLKVTPGELEKLAEAAYAAYATERSPSFDSNSFEATIGADLFTRLLHEGVVQRVDTTRVKFDHQLKHDFLAARRLAKAGVPLWGSDAFDAISFESDSPYGLIMTLEQLTETGAADRFLERVYDWNWRVALSCLLQSSRTGRVYSKEMETALLALVTDKRFDRVQASRERVEAELKKYRVAEVEQYLTASNSADLVVIASATHSSIPWFARWKAIFAREPSQSPLTEEEVQLITHPHSVIGWAAANVIRRFPELEEAGVRQLRAIYYAGVPVEESGPGQAIRWRVTHALGVFPDEKNATVLFHALDKDRSDWVKYGAVRALVEMAATTIDTPLGTGIVDGLLRRSDGLPLRLLEEVGRVVFFRGAKTGWIAAAITLLQKVVAAHQGGQGHKRWEQMLEQFRTGNWEQ